jgi:hypothetical protein
VRPERERAAESGRYADRQTPAGTVYGLGVRFSPVLTVAWLCACNGTSSPPGAPPAAVPGSSREMATAFLPTDYTGEILTDFAAMRRNGLLDRLERLPMVGSWLEDQALSYGCDLGDVQRVRTALVFDPEGTGRSMRMISVVEVDPLAEPVAMREGWHPWAQGSVRGHRFDHGAFTTLMARPAPGIVVVGERELVAPQLANTAGGPHPQLRPFLAGDRILFQYGAGTFGRRAHTLTGTVGFHGHDDPDDPCEFFRLRLAEDSDGGLELSTTLRYRPESPNLRRTERELREFIDRTQANPEFSALKPMLQALVVRHDERHLHVSLSLGSPSDAIRTLERAVLALVATGNARTRR